MQGRGRRARRPARWSHVAFLADDALQGRETGSPGHRKAAGYVAGEFERLGLEAAGTDGYLQPVELKSLTIDEAHIALYAVAFRP